MDLIDRIGAVLGLAAFLGLAVLALLYFQQARDIRRLREWAGKAPERAAAAAAQAGTGEGEPPAADVWFGSRVAAAVRSGLARIGRPFARAWEAFDRRSPIDPRVLVPVLAVAAIAGVVFLAHPFGLLQSSSDSSGGTQHAKPSPDQIEVAVLNGTATATSAGVPGLARQIGQQVKSAGYKLGNVGDASASFPTSEIMFQPGHKSEATDLAKALESSFGATKAIQMTTDVSNLAGGATLALVVGADHAQP